MTSYHPAPPLEALLAHRAWVRALARRLADNAVDADDLEQDAWLAAARARPQDGVGIRAWFAKVMRNRAAERHRLAVRRTTRESAVARSEETSGGAALVVDAEAHARVVLAVLALDEPYRETVLLRFYEGLPPRDVAARMGVPVDTVRTRLRRAAEVLRVALGGERDDWLGALAPLLVVPHGAPSPVALVGGIAMQASTKVLAATVVLALAGAGWLAWKTNSDSAPPNTATVATAPVAPTRGSSKAPVRPSDPRGGIDGTTTIAGAPAPAHVAAWRLGMPRGESAPARGPLVAIGIRMSEVPLPAAANREADTDAAGVFVLDGLEAGAWRVVATFDDGRRAARVADVAQARSRVTLDAPAGRCSLRGRAVHGDGRAFAGWVGVRQGEQQEADEAVWCLTGEGGTFAFAGLAPLGTRIFAADGATTFASVGGLTLPYDGEYLLVVDGGLARRGRVVAAKDGSPLAGATVVLRGSRPGPPWVQRCFRVTTKADGRFEFAWSGAAQIDAWADAFESVTFYDDGGAGEIVVRLARNGAVAGRVVRAADGSPVAGATVRVHPSRSPWNDGDLIATSAADGTYRVEGVPPGEASVFALGGGWVSRGFTGVTSGGFDPFAVKVESDATATADVVVESSARAEGRVVDADGAPVAAARVSAWAMMTYVPQSRARTAADGSFSFDDLVPGIPLTFDATRRDGASKRLDPLVAESGRTLHVEIRFDPERRIEVTVLEEGTEKPIADALISAAASPRHPSVGVQPQWATDAAGRADVGPVGGGTIGVRATAHGFVGSQDDVVAEEIDAAHLRAVVHLARGVPITGRVTAPEGVPVEGVAISAYSVVDSAAAMRGARTYGTAGWTRVDGSFTVEGVPDGSYVVRATTIVGGRTWQASAEGVHPGDAALALRLATSDTNTDLVVRVLDAAGTAVDEARVRFKLTSGNSSTSGGAPVRGGRAMISIPRGAVSGWIVAFRPVAQASAATPPGAVAATVSLPEPLPAEFEVRLPAEKRISGRVIAPDGSGVRGIRVFALPTGPQFDSYGSREETAHSIARTGADGSFDLGGLGDFTYELQFDLVPGYAGVPWTKVAAGTSGVEVRLSAGRELTLTIFDADGRPVRGCYVFVGGAATNAFTTAEGVAKFALDPAKTGPTWLIVTPPEDRDDVLELRDYSWTPRDAEVRLERALGVAGIVRDAMGRAVAGATVYAAGDAGFSNRVETGGDGRFRVAGLRAGAAVRLRAVPPGAFELPGTSSASVRATAGDTDVALVLDTSTSICVRVEGLPKTGWTEYLVTVSPSAGAAAAPVSTMNGIVRRDGTVRLSGLDATARNTFFVGPTAEGTYGFVRDLAPGGDDVVVRLVRGDPLAGRVVAPEGVDVMQAAVTASGDGWQARTQPDREGRFRFQGLPPGPCDVLAYVLRDGRITTRGTTRAATGADVVVEMKPASDGR
jgi:RNA polymerase sigma factor (sigma-70 family)